jgi:hypothetical protein
MDARQSLALYQPRFESSRGDANGEESEGRIMLFDLNKNAKDRDKAKAAMAESIQRAKCGCWIGLDDGGGVVQFLTCEMSKPTAQELLGFIAIAQRLLTDRIMQEMERG